MTVAVEYDDRRAAYVVTNPSGQSEFVIDFPVDSITLESVTTYGIAAYIDDVLVSSDDYTIDLDAGTLTFDTAVAQNKSVVLEGATLPVRALNYPLRGGLPSSQLNQEGNRFYYMLQELLRSSSRALRLKPSVASSFSPLVPSLSANQSLMVNEDGDGFTGGPTANEISSAQTYATNASNSADAAAADAVATAADRVQTALDVIATAADAVATAADAVATAADRAQTGLDADATAADRVQTALDVIATAADAVATAADRVQTGLDADDTAADAVATAADRVQTGLDVTAAAVSAAAAVDAALAAQNDITEKVGIAPTVDLIAVPDYIPDLVTSFTRATTATRVNRFGLIEQVASGELRHEYDPATGDYKGWLFEESTTNLLTYSEQLDNAAWTKTRSSISANDIAAPDGQTTADKLVEDSSMNTHLVNHAASVTTGNSYVFSVFAKADERSELQLAMLTGFDTVRVDYDLAAGTAAVDDAGAGVDYGIEEYPDGWYRCWISTDSNSTTTATFNIYLHNGTSTSYAGDGSSGLHLWGAQVENRTSPTSYIPTVASTVTRNDDSFSLLASAYDWLNGDEGTLYVEMQKPDSVANTTSMVGVQINDNSNNNYAQIQIYTDTLVRATSVGGGVSMGVTNTALSGAILRGAFAYKSGETPSDNTAVNGTASTSGSTAVTYSGLDRMRIGANNTAGTTVNERSYIRRVTYWPKRLTASQLAAITG